MTELPSFDWSGAQDAIDHLDNNGLVPLADAVRSLEAHDTAATVQIGQHVDNITSAVKQLDAWLALHAPIHDAYLIMAARQLLTGEPT